VPWLHTLTDWFNDNKTLVWSLSIGSLVLFLLTPFIGAWLITKLPADYFAHDRRRALESLDKHPALRVAALVAKSVLGLVLLIAGLLMLVAPGQGILTVIAGLLLLEFPGKYRLERWLATRRQVWRTMNWLRKRAGRPELKKP
jgi:hypothetical protein